MQEAKSLYNPTKGGGQREFRPIKGIGSGEAEVVREFLINGKTLPLSPTWTPKVCRIMALMAIKFGFRAIILHTFGV